MKTRQQLGNRGKDACKEQSIEDKIHAHVNKVCNGINTQPTTVKDDQDTVTTPLLTPVHG